MTLPRRLWFSLPVLAGALLIQACGDAAVSRRGDGAVCADDGLLRVGVLSPEEGRAQGRPLPEDDQFTVRELLMAASGCEVQLEPAASPDLARSRLASGDWDAAFLPPGLTAFAMAQPAAYSPVRSLGTRRDSRAQILVRPDSPIRERSQLQGRSVALLPRGSLAGFYLPLYNLHGVGLGAVHYRLSFRELAALLGSGAVDAIAWDARRDAAAPGSRVLVRDAHPLPMGAFVLSGASVSADFRPFLARLDQQASKLPDSLAYAAGEMPDREAFNDLMRIVSAVESWSLPAGEGRPHRVYGSKGEIDS